MGRGAFRLEKKKDVPSPLSTGSSSKLQGRETWERGRKKGPRFLSEEKRKKGKDHFYLLSFFLSQRNPGRKKKKETHAVPAPGRVGPVLST